MTKILIKHKQIIRLNRLLDMLYKPSEIAEETGIHEDTIITSYIPLGLPHIRQSRTYLIHGLTFIAWVHQARKKSQAQKTKLRPHEAWCAKCNRVVKLQNPFIKYSNRYIHILQSTCLHCGCKINKFTKREAQ